MIFSFLKKVYKYYLDKLINWLRMKKFDLELNLQIKKFHKNWIKDNAEKKPKIQEVGKFGDDGWSISIGDIKDGD
tara:strand:- start:509 stop:733 length:225 start_codon:yes stop_codon:yes gene_type:complete